MSSEMTESRGSRNDRKARLACPIPRGTQRAQLDKLVVSARWLAAFSALGLYIPVGTVAKCRENICTSILVMQPTPTYHLEGQVTQFTA